METHGLLLALLVCSLVFTLPARARADKIDDYIKVQMQKRHIPGLSLAVVRDGQVVKAKGYGAASLELNAPATPDTVYQLASVTKQFTATAIMLLAQDGKLEPDDPINRYLEEAPDAWKEITVRQLLTHTSGIKDYLNDEAARSREETTPEKILKSVAGLPLDFAPGEKHAYSNTNYVLLSMIVHKVSGKSYDQFLTERVFKPLEMTATRLTRRAEIIPNRAAGYTWTGDAWRNSNELNPTVWDNGDGGMLSSVRDLAKWDAALYGDAILTERSRREMWTAVKLNDGKTAGYGFGWAVETRQGHRLIWHSGGRPGTSTVIVRYLDDKLTLIMLANTDNVQLFEPANKIAGFYIAALAPPVYKPIRDAEPQVTAQVKAIMDGYSTGKPDADLAPPGIPILVSNFPGKIDSMRALAESIHRLGAVHSIKLVERTNQGDDRMYRYRVTYPSDSLLVDYWFNRENKIVRAGFQME